MITQGLLFRNEVKKRLIDLNMTQVQLANKLGISPAYLSDIIKGNRGSEDYITKITTILNMDDKQNKH